MKPVRDGNQNIQPNKVKTVAQVWPRFMAAAKIKTPSAVLQASTPKIISLCALRTAPNSETYHGQRAPPMDHFASSSAFMPYISKATYQRLLVSMAAYACIPSTASKV